MKETSQYFLRVSYVPRTVPKRWEGRKKVGVKAREKPYGFHMRRSPRLTAVLQPSVSEGQSPEADPAAL